MNHRVVRAAYRVLPLLALSLAFTAPVHAQDAASLFKTKCAACHGADGSGDTTVGKQLGAEDLRDEKVQKQTDAQLIDSTTNGKGKKMPAYKDKLSEAQIKGLVGYIRDLAKKKQG